MAEMNSAAIVRSRMLESSTERITARVGSLKRISSYIDLTFIIFQILIILEMNIIVPSQFNCPSCTFNAATVFSQKICNTNNTFCLSIGVG